MTSLSILSFYGHFDVKYLKTHVLSCHLFCFRMFVLYKFNMLALKGKFFLSECPSFEFFEYTGCPNDLHKIFSCFLLEVRDYLTQGNENPIADKCTYSYSIPIICDRRLLLKFRQEFSLRVQWVTFNVNCTFV